MLKKFSVTNFKTFDTKRTLDFSNIRDYKFNEQCIKNGLINKSIIYGQNAVGKSNLSKALIDIRLTLFTSTNFEKESSFLNAWSQEQEAVFEYTFLFKGKEIFYTYHKSDPVTLTFEELCIDNEKLYSYDFHKKEGDFSKFKDHEELSTLNLDFWENDTVVLRYIASNTKLQKLSILKELMEFVAGMAILQPTEHRVRFSGPKFFDGGIISTIIKENKVKELEVFLKRMGVDVPLKMDIKPDGEKALYFDYERPIEFISNASSGTRALLGIFFISLFLDQIKFLFIDEFDANFHYEVAQTLFDYFKEQQDTQIVITTHNTDLMSNKFMRPDCYMILTPDRLIPIADATKRELRQGHNLEKLYQSGEFNTDHKVKPHV